MKKKTKERNNIYFVKPLFYESYLDFQVNDLYFKCYFYKIKSYLFKKH